MVAMGQDSEGLLSPLLAWWRLRQLVRHISPGDRVLDCGCGSGRLKCMLPVGCFYVGVDVRGKVLPKAADDGSVVMAVDVASADELKRVECLQPLDAMVLAPLIENLGCPAAAEKIPSRTR